MVQWLCRLCMVVAPWLCVEAMGVYGSEVRVCEQWLLW